MSELARRAAFLIFNAGRTADRFVRVTDYLGAGTRQLADMREDSVCTWRDFYRTHPSHDGKLLPWEEDVVTRFVRSASDVLVIGCGSGRDVVAFAERGCRVTGVDSVDLAIGECRRILASRDLTAELVQGFFEDAHVTGAFETVVFSYYCYAAMLGTSRRVDALRKAAGLLKSGGHIIISHAVGNVPPRRILIQLGRLAGRLAGSDWRLEPGDLVWSNPGTAPSYSCTHVFAEGEVEREARSAGLQVDLRQVADNTAVFVLRSA